VLLAQIPKQVIALEDSAFNEYFIEAKVVPTVKGKILNLPGDSIRKIKVKCSIVTPLEQLQIEKVSEVNEDGTFEVQLDYPFPYQQIWIRVGDLFYAGIYANKDLYIELDADKIKKKLMFNGEGVKYMGTDGELNNFINNHVLFQRKRQLDLSKKLSILESNLKLEYDTFIIGYDALYSQIYAIDNEYLKQNPSQFSWIIENERESDYYAHLCVFHWGKEMNPDLWNKVKNHKGYLVSNNSMLFYNYLFNYLKDLVGIRLNLNWSGFSNYSKINANGKKIIDSINYIEKFKNNYEPYDTNYYKKLVKDAYIYFYDSLTAHIISTTIELLDSSFFKSKSDLSTGYINPNFISKVILLKKTLL